MGSHSSLEDSRWDDKHEEEMFLELGVWYGEGDGNVAGGQSDAMLFG